MLLLYPLYAICPASEDTVRGCCCNKTNACGHVALGGDSLVLEASNGDMVRQSMRTYLDWVSADTLENSGLGVNSLLQAWFWWGGGWIPHSVGGVLAVGLVVMLS